METMQTIDVFETVLNIDERRVSRWLRFFNYCIDMLGFYAIVFGLSMFLAFIESPLLEYVISENTGTELMMRLVYALLLALYYGASESIFNGKSLGKLITGTRVIHVDGSAISAATAFKRGFARIVPFEVFSAFSSPCCPWHDAWTDTAVVKG